MFVDDCNFCEATKWARRAIKHILKHYTKVLGQLVNYYKSKVQFPNGVHKQVCKEIIDILHIASSNTIGTYLGCSNIDKRRTVYDFDVIKHRID